MDDLNYEFSVILNCDAIFTSITFSPNATKYDIKSVMGIIKNELKGRPEGYQFSPSYRAHRWDGWISFVKDGKFPTGLTSKVVHVLEQFKDEYQYDILVIDSPFYHYLDLNDLDENYLDGVVLRDYQLDTIKKLVEGKRGIAQLATNAGKTVIIAALCKLYNGGILILLHKKELLYQTAEVIERLIGEKVGLIGDGNLDYSRRITVAMVQTLSINLNTEEFMNHKDTYTTFIIDECHHASSDTMMKVAMSIDAPHRFGFSGTPLKNKYLPDMQLIGITGEILNVVNNAYLVEEGYSAKPEIILYKIDNSDEFKKKEYSEAKDGLIINNSSRNAKIVSVASSYYMQKKVVLILVNLLEHQSNLHMLLRIALGTKNVTEMNGSQDTEYRRNIIEKMRSGVPHVYIATDVLSEGVDIPAIDVLIIGDGGKSTIKTLQRVGRGMRKKEGENKLVVIDFLDTGSKFVSRHSKTRKDIYTSQGFEITIK